MKTAVEARDTRGWTNVAMVMAFCLTATAGQAWAQVNCSSASSSADFDLDGFTDQQECLGITLYDGTPFPGANDTATPRADRLDPNSKDLFAIYWRATATLIGALNEPFKPQTIYGVQFNGMSALGVTVHKLLPGQADLDRLVSSSSTQKAVRVVESLDANGTILGNCQYGTPNGLDGCIFFTQRTKNFIDQVCNEVGDTTTDRQQVLLAYSLYLILHEIGHSISLTGQYISKYGGFHYQGGSGYVMSQYVTYKTHKGNCSIWNIGNSWNLTLDPPAVMIAPAP